MTNVANARINTFGTSPRADIVPLSEEPVFVLTSSQLTNLISQAVEKAIQSLQDEVEALKATVTHQDEKIVILECTQERDVDRICLDIAYDRQRLARLERIEPEPLQKDRGEILKALLVANGGRMLAMSARQKMRMSKQSFANLLAVLPDIKSKPLHTDKRKRVLSLK